MALKYHTYTVVTGYNFLPENLQFGYQFGFARRLWVEHQHADERSTTQITANCSAH